MNTLDSLPGEIIALVLQNCDSLSQLRNLLLTSKTIHSAWTCNQRAILWKVGQVAIPGFTDALIAVRATKIAKECFLAGELPPSPFPISDLSGGVNKPCLNDLQDVQNLAQLAQFIERKTRCEDGKTPGFMPDKWYFDSLSWDHSTWTVWRESYHRAIYRYLTAGAILARAYWEPVISPAKPSGFLTNIVSILEGIAGQESDYPDWFSDSERRYLSTIPLYDIQGYDKWGAFQQLEELFVEESRAPSRPVQPCAGLKPLYNVFGSKAKNLQSLDPGHANTLFQEILHFLYLVDGDLRFLISLPGDTPLENPEDPITHSIDAILFGSFTPVKINIRQTNNTEAAFANPLLPPLTTKTIQTNPSPIYLTFQNMHNYLKKIWDVSGIPNCYDDPIRKTAPPVAFFAEYMFRKYFGLRMSYTMFDATQENRCAWYAFHQYAGIFTGFAPGWYVGDDLLMGVDDAPGVCFDEYVCYY
ncbi:hypothetical protein BJX99DRAFT_252871 [Aspergillus californicus]